MPGLPLRLKVLGVFLLAAALPLVGMTWFGVSETQAALRDEVGRGSLDVAEAAAAYTDLYFRNAELLVGQAAQDPQLRKALSTRSMLPMELAVASLHESGRAAVPAVFERTVLLDGQGRVLTAFPAHEGLVGMDLSGSEAYRGPVTLGETFVTRILPDPVAGGARLAIAAPVFVNGTIEGVLGGLVNPAPFGQDLQRFTHSAEEEIYLAQRDGLVLSHPNASYVPGESDLGSLYPVERGLRGNKGTAEYTNPWEDRAKLAGYAPVARFGWVLVNTQPLESAYAGALKVTRLLLTGSVLLLGFAVAGGFYVAGRVAQPVKQIQRGAERIEAGHLDVQVPEGGGDELAALGRSFNRMASALKASLEGVRRSEARYRSLVENSSDLIFTLTPSGTVTFANGLAREALGRSPGELVDRSCEAFVHPEDADAFRHALRRALESGTALHNVPHRMLQADGSFRHFLTTFTPLAGPDGGERPVLTVSRDVTAAMREEEAREKLFAAARLVSEETDPHALLRKGLDLFLEHTGAPLGGVFLLEEGGAVHLAAHRGLPDRGPVHVEARPRDAGPAPAPIPVNDPVRVRLVRDVPALDPYRGDLEERGVRDVVTFSLKERGEPLGWVFLGPASSPEPLPEEETRLLDALAAQLAVGVRRARFEARLREYAIALEQKVEERTLELREKNREIEAFLYSVSHDLKAPLISIQGYLAALEEEYGSALGEDGGFYLGRLRKNATAMERLILDLLELSRIGRVGEAHGPVDLEEVVREVLDQLQDRIRHAGAEVEVGILPTLPGQRERLRQLFANLLENAVKYHAPGRPPRIRVTAEREGSAWVVRVADNGLGIPGSARDRLFQLFQRFHAASLPEVEGTGMGLAIVRRIVDTHGGGVEVESVEGEGTTFLIRLPVGGVGPHPGKAEAL